MNLGLTPLFDVIAAGHDQAFILATVIETHGPSYRKPGAMMLIGEDGVATGLVSGGCLENDLRLQGQSVLESGQRRMVTYDLREDDDELWGLGLGCQGVIHLHLERADQSNQFAGLGQIAPLWQAGQYCVLSKLMSNDLTQPSQWQVASGNADEVANTDSATMLKPTPAGRELTVPVVPPVRLLICGAGPDVPPLVTMAAHSGWRVVVYDHRPSYAKPTHFSDAQQVICDRPEALLDHLTEFDAAVIMSHHLLSDIAYARAIATTAVRYIGLLGPTARRIEVMSKAELGDDSRCHGPAGLDIGADLPETIALSILAEAHAAVNGGSGGSLHRLAANSDQHPGSG